MATIDDDRRALTQLNTRIAEAENAGDREWLASICAPRLAFQRADEARTVDDHIAFLQKVKGGGPPRLTRRIVEPIAVHGNRAIVECIVAVGDKEFHNLRLFVRRDDGWKLLGWANEAV